MMGRRFLATIAVLFLLASGLAPSWAQLTKPSITTQIANCFPDNSTGAITPAIVRGCLDNIVNSYQQYAGVNPQVGTSYALQTTDYGQLVTFTNASSVAVTLPRATGSFATWNAYVSNLGTGTVTVTPTTSTINGSSSLTLATGQTAWIVSDETNYQVWLGANSGSGFLPTVQSGQVLGNNGAGAALAAAIGLWSGSPPTIGNIVLWNTSGGGGAFFSDSGVQLAASGAILYATPSGSGGLDTGNCKTLATACTLRRACEIRSSIFSANTISILITSGTYSDVDLALGNTLCAINGNAGGSSGALTSINVISGTAILAVPSNDIGIDVDDKGQMSVVGVTITGGANSVGINCRQFSVCDYQAVTWGSFTSNGIHVQTQLGGSVNCVTSEIINTTTAFTAHWYFNGTGQASLGCTTTVLANLTYSDFIISQGAFTIYAQSWSLSNTGSFTLTGTKADLVGPGFLVNGGTACSSFFPGSIACVISPPFADDAGEIAAKLTVGSSTASGGSSGCVPYFDGSSLFRCGSGVITDGTNLSAFSGTLTAAAGKFTGLSTQGATCNDASGNLSTSTTGCTNEVVSAAHGGTGNTTAAAEQARLAQPYVVVTATGVNFNATGSPADNALVFTLPSGYTRVTLDELTITNASHSLVTATFGVFTATSGGGTALIASGTAITLSATTDQTANNAQRQAGSAISAVASALATPNTIYFRVTNPEGATATGDVTAIFRIAP
jgi:hypothetical protein